MVAFKAPITLQRRMHALSQTRGMKRGRVDDVTTLHRIGGGGQVDALAVIPRQAQRHVMRITGRKYQRRAVDRQHQDGSAGAVNLLGIYRMQRRKRSEEHTSELQS